ncbi:hypothetical protein A1O3_08153 [Capronia epimyces CBS 606.96]|uniref:Pumilio homology domain family member 3 n=1 Tax=Capronia epimyces CBS 606.96 TaxID=1182542 RepID=W9XI52_9EURO|nr:uncharacterized protein A1O3_08153 [Capronia epimyces CBS 606.96]EXJ79868.1 hypothetical protein A1O3_08153 [Capronia epimyces CBS 606.96]
MGNDFEVGKNAWNTTSRIWGTNKSFLESDVDKEPMRPSPVRQMSTSNYTQGRLDANSFLASTESSNENALPSTKLPWGSTSNSIRLSSRSRGQPLSPTTHRQNRGLDLLSNDVHGDLRDSSLFAGSSPDVEVGSITGQQAHQSSGVVNTNSRFRQSPPRETNYNRGQVEAQIQAVNSNRFNRNGIFTSISDYNNGPELSSNGLQSPNGNALNYSQQNGHTTRGPMFREETGSSSRFLSAPPIFAGVNDHSVQGERFQSCSSPQVEETIRSLRALSFDQAQELEADTQIIPTRRTSVPQPHHPRDILAHPVTTHVLTQPSFFNTVENRFHPSAGDVQSSGCQLEPQAAPHYTGLPNGGRAALSPLTSDYRSSLHSPLYATTGTPPTGLQSIRSTPTSRVSSRTSHNDTRMGDRKFLNLEQYGFDQSPFIPNPVLSQIGNGFLYDYHRPAQPIRMNPLAHPYIAPVHPTLHDFPTPRIQIREADQNQVVRSPLLEEFRANSKTNRRFELKDIYNHVVEFSGDQHASRFIQQKLETANSDEKEQIFKEIQPNVLQLMTDVFGNYVIQKLFEHGNQSQKKVLANQMKGHVLHLSLQMYGCRVVQKAFEHVLTDQQASLVKELDGPNLQILKVVKDQNGNHVVQKAIERIPGDHIQFIVDAHRGQVAKMSTHQYGCRVVQRMLEYCRPQAKRVILDELLEYILPLISDSYGNYVVQHIIQNGEPRDRRHVVDIVLQQLLTFSKHKFASNIVEKSIDYADADQRAKILCGLTAPDEQGVTPVLGLMRDQYGNYVLQKVHSQLQGAELLTLEAEMKRNYPVLRRTSYGKQVMAMEKLLFTGNGPSTATTSNRSSALPSTNASSSGDVEGTPSLQPGFQ